MDKIKIRINGIETEAEPNKTILDVAQGLGIFIPTLCHHKALIPRGACRLCIVEDRGKIKAACTMPVEPGMEIITDSPRIQHIRELTLQMIFTGRNHYCMYCEVSGDCELQDLGYKMGMDHFRFSTYDNRYPVDSSHPYILFDHNRCVVCGRCIRACSELAGHFVLTERSRGVKTLVVSDIEVPMGQSSCVSCGTCVQVCPTGALIEKRAAYQKNRKENAQIKTVCTLCPVECGIEVHKNPGTNSVIKIHGDWDASPTHGILCKLGRYTALYGDLKRISSARVRKDGMVKEISLDEAISTAREKINKGIAYVNGTLFNEDLALIKEIFEKVYAINPVSPPVPSSASIDSLNESGLFIIFRLDLDAEYGAIGSLIKRRVGNNEAKIILIDGPPGVFPSLPVERMSSSEFLSQINKMTSGVAVFRDLDDKEKTTLSKTDVLKKLWLPPETNTIGLSRHNIQQGTPEEKTLFFFGRNMPADGIKDSSFVVSFSPYENQLTQRADMVIPVQDGFEQQGTVYNLEGEIKHRDPILTPPSDIMNLRDLLSQMRIKG